MILIRAEERAAAERKKNRLLAVYIAVACAFVAAVLLLLFLSSDRYAPFMIADVIVSVAFGFYSVYFFTVSYDCAVKRYRLLDKVACAMADKEYGVFLREEDNMTIDGVEMRIMLFRVRGDEREFHLFESEATFLPEKKYLLEAHAGVLTEVSEVDE